MNEGDDSQIEYIVCIQQFLLTLDTKDFRNLLEPTMTPHFLDYSNINSIIIPENAR